MWPSRLWDHPQDGGRQGSWSPRSLGQIRLTLLEGVTEGEIVQIFPFLDICFQPIDTKMCGHGWRDDV